MQKNRYRYVQLDCPACGRGFEKCRRLLGHEVGLDFVYLCTDCRTELVESPVDKGFQVRDRFLKNQRMAAVTHKSECVGTLEALDRWNWYSDREGE